MLGRHHVTISLATILPFLIPLIFLENNIHLIYSIGFLIAVLIGSLIPDSDCGGKAKIYYDFPIVHKLMIPINKLVIFIFRIPKLKTKIKGGYEVKEEHRGIMHSPSGIIISSLILALFLSIFLIVIGFFNLIFLLVVLFGLLFGQLLHLLEDSCTISGIRWKFPFSEGIIKGNISTIRYQKEGKLDIRPDLFSIILGILSLGIFIGFVFYKITFSLWFYYPIILGIVSLLWIIFIYLSKSKINFWYWEIGRVNNLKKSWRRVQRNPMRI